MKKLRTSLLTVLISLSYVAISQTIVSTEIESKNPVIFDFTGIHCVSCPKAHKTIAVAKTHYPQLVALTFHAGNFASPNPGEKDFRTIEGDSIHDNIAFYDSELQNYQIVWSYPTLTINNQKVGYNSINDTSQFLQDIEEVISEESIVNIGALASIDTLTRELSLKIECYYTSSPIDSNFLFVSFCQNDLKSAQSGASEYGDNYIHKEMFRGFISNTWGDPIGKPQEGDLIVKEYFFSFPDSIKHNDSQSIELLLQNIEIQVYISGIKEKVNAYDYFGEIHKNRIVYEINNGINAGIEYIDSNGIDESKEDSNLIIFPQPAKDFITLDFGENYKTNHNLSLTIYNIEGKKVKKIDIKNLSSGQLGIPLAELKQGIYFMQIEGKELFTTKRFILN
jgi:thiol-disulfide isomerase/thioredoxin